MSKKKVVVPEGMKKAALIRFRQVCGQTNPTFDDYWELRIKDVLESALLWWSENPIVPTDEQCSEMMLPPNPLWDFGAARRFIAKWQSRMFRAPEPR